jgi:hypothetical protein
MVTRVLPDDERHAHGLTELSGLTDWPYCVRVRRTKDESLAA